MKAFARCLRAGLVWLSVYACLCASAFADPAPQLLVRAHLEPAGPVVAGSEVKLVVDLLTTTWFTEAPDWPLFTVPDAIVSLPDEQADNLSEDIGGVRWFGVSRAYRIAPQAGKTYQIAPFAITVHPGGMNVPVKVMTPALKLVTTLPPGAEGMSTFFATTKLTVTQKIEPSKEHIRVGDPVTRTITQSAAGTESMLIPPAVPGEIDGLKRYVKPPTTRNVVQDRVGLVAGERTDSVTYIADHSGRFTLPPVTIKWWNSTTRKKETVALPGATFSAAAAHEKPLFEIPAEAMSQGMPHRILVIHSGQWIAGCVLAAVLILLIWARGRITAWARGARQRARHARRRYLEGDAVAWRELSAAARQADVRHTIAALYRWLDRRDDFGRPARVDQLPRAQSADVARLVDTVVAHYGASCGSDAIDASAASDLAPERGSPRADNLVSKPTDRSRELHWRRALGTLRRLAWQARAKRRSTSPLPPLNEY
ncbi:MAG TPA: BatD family protein [Paraburkholderia sp.]|jgi:hypothetical protein|nr:BatD family protein [Paraburkholderia sp.]